MDLQEIVQTRTSVRAYRQDPVPRELVIKILEAANRAPTACNYQPFRFFVKPVKGNEDELKKVYPKDWLVQASWVILAAAVPSESWSRSDGKNYADVDATIAFDHLILAAQAEGLGTCWVAAFHPDETRRVFQLPAGWEPLALTPLGYPGENSSPRKRKPLADWVVWQS